ncbi:MAG: hypothetical protein JXA03_03805 [Bacteroidales bacterium]|nr:hypothetical protein [Bacteroidales bacterium]
MQVFKFRILTDIDEDFLRDVELLSNHTFEDFHHALQNFIPLNGKELASFHICDQDWIKNEEITLIDMMEGDSGQDDIRPHRVFIMQNTVLSDYILEEGQRLLYEYDFLNMHTFFIELINIKKPDSKTRYPLCSMKKGELVLLPDEVGHMAHEEELSRKLLNDFNDILKRTYDYGDDDAMEGDGFDD